MNRAKIVLLCLGAAMAYGVGHDQITVRLRAILILLLGTWFLWLRFGAWEVTG